MRRSQAARATRRCGMPRNMKGEPLQLYNERRNRSHMPPCVTKIYRSDLLCLECVSLEQLRERASATCKVAQSKGCVKI